jgi:hypothetical protein
MLTAEHHVDNFAVPVQDCSPHLEAETTILVLENFAKLRPESVVVREEVKQPACLDAGVGDAVIAAAGSKQDGRC